MSVTNDFSQDSTDPEPVAIISVVMENNRGREAQTLQSDGRTYNDYGDPGNSDDAYNTGKSALPTDYGKALFSNFKIQPRFAKEDFYYFQKRALSNLKNPRFIREKSQPVLVETVRRQVLAEFYRHLFNAYSCADNAGSTVNGNNLALLERSSLAQKPACLVA